MALCSDTGPHHHFCGLLELSQAESLKAAESPQKCGLKLLEAIKLKLLEIKSF